MCTRTLWRAQPPTVTIRHVALVIRRIEVLTVPTAREDDSRADPLGAVLERQLCRVLGVAGREALAVSEAAVADGGLVLVRLGHGVAGEHAEAGLEGGHFAVGGRVRHVVDGHAAVLLDADIGKLRDTLERAVFRGAEVEGGGPVVGEVLGGIREGRVRGKGSRFSGYAPRSMCRWCMLRGWEGRIWLAPSVRG